MSSSFSNPVATIDCTTAVRRLWDYLDGELDAPRFAEVEQHVATCASCAEHVRFSRAFLSAVRDAAAPSDVSEGELRKRVVSRLVAEGFQRA